MILHFAFALLGALNGVIGAPAHTAHVLHERRELESSAWLKLEPVHPRTVLPMRIGLVQSNMEHANRLLMEVSSHQSPKYGKYYSANEVIDLFAPAQDTVDAVRHWLESSGIPSKKISLSTNKQWIQFDAYAKEAEELLKTKYHIYGHRKSGRTNIACDEYHLPAHIQGHVDYITPGIKLSPVSGLPSPRNGLQKRTFGFGSSRKLPAMKPLPEELMVEAESLAMCDSAVTPQCIMAMYNITAGTTATAGNELGIFEDIGDVYSQGDFDNFFTALFPQIPNGTHPILHAIDGAVAPTSVANAGAESDLDFQISYPIIWPQNSILFQTDDPVYEANYTFPGFLNNMFDALDGSYCNHISPLDPPYPDPNPGGFKGNLQCGVYTPTNVLSISYGGAEADLPISYQRRQCKEIMKLGLRGVTVVVSSGDSGVAGRDGDPTPSDCLGENNDVFAPQFPATCPYLTAVGATFLPTGASAAADEEVAVSRFPSGGGFSNIYNQSEAPWQDSHVKGYFAQNLFDYPFYESTDNSSFNENGGIYNRIGRGYPDVAAIGDNVVIYNEGEAILIGGTSAAAPAFASMLVRINEERLAANKSTVGFVNPILYAHPEVFHDITSGNNTGCGTAGFFAADGWDPVTGLGTPNYPDLLELFMKQS